MNARLSSTLARALLPMAPPSSIVHQVLSEDGFLQADLDIFRMTRSGELERRREREAMRLQQQYQDQIGSQL